MKFGLALMLGFLTVRPALPQEVAAPETVKKGQAYRSRATIAVLPGNPFDSRLYSLQWNVLNPAFIAKLLRDHSVIVGTSSGPFVCYRPESSFEVTFESTDVKKAVAVVKATMDALIQEIKTRSVADPGYGNLRIQMPPKPVTSNLRTGAEGVLVMDGLQWGQADRQKASSQINALRLAISDMETLRAVAKQDPSNGSLRTEDLNAIARQIHSSIWFHYPNDSWMDVTLTAPDPTFLERLLDLIPKEKVDLSGRLPLADIDFVPKAMRNQWYIFNCCRTSPN